MPSSQISACFSVRLSSVYSKSMSLSTFLLCDPFSPDCLVKFIMHAPVVHVRGSEHALLVSSCHHPHVLSKLLQSDFSHASSACMWYFQCCQLHRVVFGQHLKTDLKIALSNTGSHQRLL